MVKSFILLGVVVLVAVGCVVGDYLGYDRPTTQEQIDSVVALTGFSSLALSVAYYESRTPRLGVALNPNNPAYPQLQSLSRVGFIYAH